MERRKEEDRVRGGKTEKALSKASLQVRNSKYDILLLVHAPMAHPLHTLSSLLPLFVYSRLTSSAAAQHSVVQITSFTIIADNIDCR